MSVPGPISDQIFELAKLNRFVEAERLIWHSAPETGWYFALAPFLVECGGECEKTNRPLAIWCYEQAQALYNADAAGASSGGEGMAMMMDNPGASLGRRIWLLKSQ